MFDNLGVPEVLVLFAVVLVLTWPAGRICRRAGYSPWLGLLVFVPLANVGLLWFIALAQWPAQPHR